MKLQEILTEDQLDELDMKKLGKTATKAAAAAGIIGALTTGMPKDTQKPATIPPVSSVQSPHMAEPQKTAPQKTVTELPDDMDKLSVAEKKQKFFDIVVPIAEKENALILKDRTKLLSIIKKGSASSDEKTWLSAMMKKYKTDTISELVDRIDVIPTSLVVAQAAIESGWGTSRFAQEGNSLFGQRDYSGGGIKPTGASGFTVAKFGSIGDSVKSYMNNLNTHNAYKGLREARKKMRDTGSDIDSLSIIPSLSKYSERGGSYIRDLSSIIKSNNLQKFDS